MEELLGAISTVGFPIALATYVIVRLEATVKKNTEAIVQLTLKLACK